MGIHILVETCLTPSYLVEMSEPSLLLEYFDLKYLNTVMTGW